jgi:1,4-dihydroxy-2-naphthoyl-CoA hydrolase
MPCQCEYTVQFRDTDAAGVVYFANILSICHIAYETCLMQAGIDLKSWVNNPEFALPITHTEADFFRPLFCGDRVEIELTPTPLSRDTLEIKYQIRSPAPAESAGEKVQIYAQAMTRHIAIDPATRRRRDLPTHLIQWIDGATFNSVS